MDRKYCILEVRSIDTRELLGNSHIDTGTLENQPDLGLSPFLYMGSKLTLIQIEDRCRYVICLHGSVNAFHRK